jgi:superfamily II DNA helicase RecQ
LRGLSVAAVNANTTSAVKAGVFAGEYGLVFFTPELLLEKKWRAVLHSKVYMSRVRALVVDEAHTVKKWYVSSMQCFTTKLQVHFLQG